MKDAHRTSAALKDIPGNLVDTKHQNITAIQQVITTSSFSFFFLFFWKKIF